MRSDDDFQKLAETYPELRDQNVILEKEVYAHFGLTFYVFGLVEHGLMNAISLSHLYKSYSRGKIKSAKEWEAAFDKQETKVHRLTFGDLVSKASGIIEFSDIADELRYVNRNRNYFAHRLFRDVAGHFMSQDGCKAILVRTAHTRDRVERLDKEVSRRTKDMLQRMKLPALDLQKLGTIQDAMIAKANADIASGSPKFGWEP